MQHHESHDAETTGIEPLDFEHRRLVAVIDDTCAEIGRGAGRDSVLDGLGLLYVRINAHFALEQRITQEQSPHRYAATRARCHALLERIGAMMDAYYEGRCHACDKSLGECLKSWLQLHLRAGHDHLDERIGATS